MATSATPSPQIQINNIQIDLSELRNKNQHESKYPGEDNPEGFYQTQIIIKNNIKQIKKHSKLITHFTAKYNTCTDAEEVAEITDRIENIIASNVIVVSQIQSLIKSESGKIAVMSPTTNTNKVDNPQYRAKGESLNVLIKSFKKSIQLFYLSLSTYNESVCSKQLSQLNMITNNLDNNDIEKLIGFDPRRRQEYIQQKFQNVSNTPRIQALSQINHIEQSRKDMEKVQKSVQDLKRLDSELNVLAIPGSRSTSRRGSRFSSRNSSADFTRKEIRDNKVSLDIVDEDGKLTEEEKKRRRNRHRCKIWCLVWIFVVFVISFAILDIQINGRWI